jgi:hypothetical protein
MVYCVYVGPGALFLKKVGEREGKKEQHIYKYIHCIYSIKIELY